MKNPSPTSKAGDAASQRVAEASVAGSRTRSKKLEAAPVGFSLEKYIGCDELGPRDWAQQLDKRWHARKALEYKALCEARCKAIEQGCTTDPEDSTNWPEELAHVTRQLREMMPDLIAAPLAGFASSYHSQGSSKAAPRPPHVRRSIRPIRLTDLHHWAELLKANGITDGDALVDDGYQIAPNLISLTAFGRIQVDLSAADEDLMEAFRIWLRGYRRQVKRPSVSRHKTQWQAEMADWCRNQLLPYTDLQLWCDWKGGKLTKERLVAILYPDDTEATPSKLRAVERDAKKYLQFESVQALRLAEA
jgi:hypothetical protein